MSDQFLNILVKTAGLRDSRLESYGTLNVVQFMLDRPVVYRNSLTLTDDRFSLSLKIL